MSAIPKLIDWERQRSEGRQSMPTADDTSTTLAPRERLIVALDLPSVVVAEAMVERLGDSVSFYKVGYQLVFAGGLGFAERLVRAGKQVFLDMKLHDIDNSVSHGVESIARLGVTFVTVHAY